MKPIDPATLAATRVRARYCEGDHCCEPGGEARVYPILFAARVILCRPCWEHENGYRRGLDAGLIACSFPSMGARCVESGRVQEAHTPRSIGVFAVTQRPSKLSVSFLGLIKGEAEGPTG
jgi:hypothetical protein